MFSKLKMALSRFHHPDAPRLKHIEDLLNAMVLGFGWFNILLGMALFSNAAYTTNFFLVNNFLDHQIWAVIYFVSGVGLLSGHFYNLWAWMRGWLQALIFLNIMWFIALMIRQYETAGANAILVLFFGLALYFQVRLFMRFPIYNKVETWSH